VNGAWFQICGFRFELCETTANTLGVPMLRNTFRRVYEMQMFACVRHDQQVTAWD